MRDNETFSGCTYEVLCAGKRASVEQYQIEHFDKWYQIMNEAPIGENDKFGTQEILDALTRDNEAADYHVGRCAEISNERIFFITSSGYVGTGSLPVAVGDVIVHVAEVSMPLVLRADGDSQYKLIGPAFIYGIGCEDGGQRRYNDIMLS
jgi:hypothetical protein